MLKKKQKRIREEEKEENNTVIAQRRCVNLVPTAAFDMFSLAGVTCGMILVGCLTVILGMGRACRWWWLWLLCLFHLLRW